MNLKKYIKNFIKYLKSGGVVYTNVTTKSDNDILRGKVALVTGGSSGFGLAIAKRLLSNGCKVVITGRNKEKLEQVVSEINNSDLKGIVWDLCDYSIADQKITEVKSFWGHLDIAVNNAGVWTPKNWNDIDEHEWDKIVNTNLKGLFFICKSVSNMMEATPENIKKIVNITSIEGLRGGFGPYFASKWGATGITRGLAKELVKKNIIVNAVAPGMAITDINPNLPKDIADNAYLECQPHNRFVLVEEVAELVSFLVSDSANSIVGQDIAIDGGWSLN